MLTIKPTRWAPALGLASGLVLFGTLTGIRAPAAPGPAVVQLGSGFGCGLSDEGTVRCWGRCGDGQCGSSGGDARTPRPVPGLDQVTQLDVGYGFACALRRDHSVWCWGDNGYFQLGSEAPENRIAPAPVPGLGHVESIALGGFHACAQQDDGRVLCWGSNSQGVLGAPEAVEKRAAPTRIRGIAGATALWSGHYNACARVRGGSLRCWGSSVHGQSGTRRRVRRAGPTRLRGADGAQSVTLADGHGCLVADSTLQCWGSNLYGANEGQTAFFSTPQVIGGLSNVTAASARSENQCAVGDGTVYCWGGKPPASA